MDALQILTQFGPLVATGVGAVIAGGIRSQLGQVRGTIAEAIPALQANVERHSGEIKVLDRIIATLPDKFDKLEIRVAHMDTKVDLLSRLWEERCDTCPVKLEVLRHREGDGGGRT